MMDSTKHDRCSQIHRCWWYSNKFHKNQRTIPCFLVSAFVVVVAGEHLSSSSDGVKGSRGGGDCWTHGGWELRGEIPGLVKPSSSLFGSRSTVRPRRSTGDRRLQDFLLVGSTGVHGVVEGNS